jgi:DNA transposase THAP9
LQAAGIPQCSTPVQYSLSVAQQSESEENCFVTPERIYETSILRDVEKSSCAEGQVVNISESPKKLARVKERKSRNALRKLLGMELSSEDTPRKKFLLEQNTKLKHKVKRLEREKRIVTEASKESKKMDNVLKLIEPKVSAEAFELLRAQIFEGAKEPRGRRYSLNLKIMAVGLWKSGPRTYRLLSDIFAIPSKRTLQKFLEKFEFLPGFNWSIFSMLHEKFRHLQHADRFVSLLWDGTSEKPDLKYDHKLDQITGYEDFGGGQRGSAVACEFLVFMVTSVNPDRKRWQQPIAYLHCSKSMDAKFLASQILFYLTLLICLGLRPVSTVCDQHPTNVKALKHIQHSSDVPVIKLHGIDIIFTFDAPHLLKCIRNLLLKNDLHTNKGIVKFEYFALMYKYDLKNFPRHCWKLKEVHIFPAGRNKMKVCYAAQLFSRSSGLYMRHLVDGQFEGFPADAEFTVEFIFLIDHWYDSVNGRRKTACTGENAFHLLILSFILNCRT